MGYNGKMTGHGFRGLASTTLHEQGYMHDAIEIQLLIGLGMLFLKLITMLNI
jgi:hypothetical protein